MQQSDSASPEISVILPTHNRAVLFRRALGSVLAQSFTDLEVIVVDNACSDETPDYLRHLDDSRVRVLRLPELLGAAYARNAALVLARGRLVAFQDDDDCWFPDKLARQREQLESAGQGVGLCLCSYLRHYVDRIELVRAAMLFPRMDFSSGVALSDFSLITTPAWLVRRDILDQAGGFDAALPARNDWELALRLLDLCRFTYVDAPLFLQDQTRATTMRSNEAAYSRALQHIVSKHAERWRDRPRVRASHAAIIGRHEATDGDAVEGRRWLLRSLRDMPWQPRLLLIYLLSWFGHAPVQWARRQRQRLRAL